MLDTNIFRLGVFMSSYPTLDILKIGQKIKQIMIQQNYTVQDIQKYLGLTTPQSIYHWFSGRNMPSIDNLYALSGLFHIPVDAMLCGNRKENWLFIDSPICNRLLIYYDRLSTLYNSN